MAAIRVYELAKQLGFDSKDFVKELKQLGVDIKNFMSQLDDEQVRRIHDHFQGSRSEASTVGQGSGGKLRVYELAKELNMDSRDLSDKLKAAGMNVKNYMSTMDNKEAEIARLIAMGIISGQEIGGSQVPRPSVIRRRKKLAQVNSETSTGEMAFSKEKDEKNLEIDAGNAAPSFAEQKAADDSIEEEPAIIGVEGKTFMVDGTNIMRGYTQKENYVSLEALLSLVLEIRRQGGAFICFFDANTYYKLEQHGKRGSDQIYDSLVKHLADCFIEVTGGTRGDDFILPEAERNGRLIISNDRFRKYRKRFSWLEKEEDCLFKGKVIRDRVVIPNLGLSVPIRKDLRSMTNELIQLISPSRSFISEPSHG